jgi:hypothetical protein
MNSFDKGVVEVALTKLFTESHFSICTLDTIGELIGVNPRVHPNYRSLHALHCVKYRDMPTTVKAGLQTKVMECLRPEFAYTGAILAKALLLEGRDHLHIEDETFSSLPRLK